MIELNKIYNESNLDTMARMPDNYISLTVTSPPYNCGKVYVGFSDNLSWEKYWELTEMWLIELYRVTITGGRIAVNLPWWMLKKTRRDVCYMFKYIAIKSGWIFLDKIIWVKGDANNK